MPDNGFFIEIVRMDDQSKVIAHQKGGGVIKRSSIMKNFIKILGIVALLAAIGFSVVSCDLMTTVVTFDNQSSFTVDVVMETGKGWTPGSFSVKPDKKQEVTTTQSVSTVKATYSPSNKVEAKWNASTNTYTFTDL